MAEKPERRWYHLTLDRFLVGLLAAEGLLLLTDRFGWFGLKTGSGWSAMLALALPVALGSAWFSAALLLRHRFQYSLRTLLVVVLLASIGLSWFTVKMHQANKQAEVVAAILDAGGEVAYDYQEGPRKGIGPPAWLRKLLGDDFFGDVVAVAAWKPHFGDAELRQLKSLTELEQLFLRKTWATDGGLEHISGLTKLRALSLAGTQVTDAGLKHIKGLANLESLLLGDTQVSDAGLEHLKGLTNLAELQLDRTQVTGAGLEHLKGLTKLGVLNLSGAQITDAGLKRLQGFTSLHCLMLANTQVSDSGLLHLKELLDLRTLMLSGTQVTDAGLEHLKELTRLVSLGLENTKVTGEGVKRLQEALPKCGVIWP